MPVNDLGSIANLSLDYTKQWTTGVAEVAGVTTDALGNVYTIGSVRGTVDFDASQNPQEFSSGNNAAMFLQKQDGNGNFVWVKPIALRADDSFGQLPYYSAWPNVEHSADVGVDAAGNIYTVSQAGLGKWDSNGNQFWLKDILPEYAERLTTTPLDLSVDRTGNAYVVALTGLEKFDQNGNSVWRDSDRIRHSDVDVDEAGALYAIGTFSGIVDFDPGAGIANFDSANGGIFIRKLDANGALGWVKQFLGGINGDSTLTVDASNQGLYFSGFLRGTADFDPGAGIANLQSSPDNFFGDVFAGKLDQSGNFIWARNFAAKSQSTSYRQNHIGVDPQGNLYISGRFFGTVDFDPGAGVTNLTKSPLGTLGVSAVSPEDTFVSKLDVNGNFVWAKQFAGGNNGSNGMSVDRQGNTFTVGNFYAAVDFDPGLATQWRSGAPATAGFLAKLNSAGNFGFAQQYGNSGGPSTVASDDRGNVYVAGNFAGTVDFDPGLGRSEAFGLGRGDAFISKLDGVGNYLWSRSFGGIELDAISKVKVDRWGDVYASGIFVGTADFDPGVGVFNLTSTAPGREFGQFITKFDANGNWLWAKQVNPSTDSIRDFVIDADRNVYVAGEQVTRSASDVLSVDAVLIEKINANGSLAWSRRFTEGGSGYFRKLTVDGSGQVEGIYQNRYLKLDRAGNVLVQENIVTPNSTTESLDRQGNRYTYQSTYSTETRQWSRTITKRLPNGNVVWTETFADFIEGEPSINLNGDIYLLGGGVATFSLRKFSQPKPPTEIFWRNPQTAEPVIWNLRNGTELVDARYLTYGSGIGDARAGQIVRYDATWRVAANVDMNGDRVRDFVYTRDGEIRVLTVGQLNGQTATVETDREYTFSAKFGSLSGQAARPFAGWELVGVEDMSGDGQRDFVFYSRQFDRTVIWFTDRAGTITEGAVVTSAARPGGQETGAPFAWNVQAIGDFTGDGKVDMLWRNDQDLVVLWELDGTVLRTGPGSKTQLLPSIGSSFKVRGVGDFNGDGVQDILWRDQAGNVNRIWTFGTDGKRTEVSLLSATNSQWEIGGVADLNGDGTTDLIWRNNQENNVVVWNIRDAALFGPGSGYVLNYFPSGNQQVINPGRSFRIESVQGVDPVT
jgi:hypothetical protein